MSHYRFVFLPDVSEIRFAQGAAEDIMSLGSTVMPTGQGGLMREPSGGRFEELVRIMERLRADGGCPWDREQTRESLKPFLIEEAYEVVEAIDEGDPKKLMEELGDLLFQVVFH